MKFEFEHVFSAPVAKVEESFLSPGFLEALRERMTSVKEIEALDFDDQGRTVRRRVRYRLHPIIKRVGLKKVPPEAFEWVEESEYDRETHSMTFTNVLTHPRLRPLFINRGRVTLTPDGAKTVRRLEGELVVNVPVLGRVAEKVVHSRAAEILAEESKILESLIKE